MWPFRKEARQTRGGLTRRLSLPQWLQRRGIHNSAPRPVPKARTTTASEILDKHFAYQEMIQTSYANRNRDRHALASAIKACQQQISFAPKAAKAFKQEYPAKPLPQHVGFTQSAIVYEKEGAYAEASQLSREAIEQGWAGDWEKRIARCEAKLRPKKNPGT